MTKRKRWLFAAAAAFMSATLALVSAELLVRMSGRKPWRYLATDAKEPTVHEPEPELGWQAKAGSYVVGPWALGSRPARITFLADGSRATGPQLAGARDTLAFVGCSITQGWAVSDDETFAWRIQQRFPAIRVLNYGTSAYGTYQSLLRLERLLSAPTPPRAVVYGFIEEHEPRNVAHPNWLRLLALHSRRGIVATPYCTLTPAGQLQRHSPIGYPVWPLQTHLASVALLADAYMRLSADDTAGQARTVTEHLLLAMNELTRAQRVRFRVALLHFSPPPRAHYVAFLEENGIPFVDCAFPIGAALQVPGEGHPNAEMHARWADCLAPAVSADVKGP